jgi:hypothetical protein
MKAARTMSETLCLKVSLSCMVFWLLLRRVVDALSCSGGCQSSRPFFVWWFQIPRKLAIVLHGPRGLRKPCRER